MQVTVHEFSELVQSFRAYVRNLSATYINQQRFGAAGHRLPVNKLLLYMAILEKIERGNIRREQNDILLLPAYVSVTCYNKLQSNLKTIMR